MSVMWIKNATKSFLVYPSSNKSFKYTGEEISPTWINYNPEEIIISGTLSAIEIGRYTTTFTPRIGFCWSDGSVDSYTVEWGIFTDISAYPQQINTLTYNGSSLSPEWQNYDTNIMSFSGTDSAVDAGEYTAVFTLKEGCGWEDGKTEPYNATWRIEKKERAVYLNTSSSISLKLSENKSGTIRVIVNETTSTSIGSYKLTDNTVVSCSRSSTYTGSDYVTLTYTVKPLAVGNTVFSYTTKEETNYKSGTCTCAITVTA